MSSIWTKKKYIRSQEIVIVIIRILLQCTKTDIEKITPKAANSLLKLITKLLNCFHAKCFCVKAIIMVMVLMQLRGSVLPTESIFNSFVIINGEELRFLTAWVIMSFPNWSLLERLLGFWHVGHAGFCPSKSKETHLTLWWVAMTDRLYLDWVMMWPCSTTTYLIFFLAVSFCS